MIIVRLSGGLGNQLFQYAVGRKLAIRTGMPLKLDISVCRPGHYRSYGLQRFHINADLASEAEIARFLGFAYRGLSGRVARVLRRHIQRRISYHRRLVIHERTTRFDPDVLRISHRVYLDGYWQSEKYFKDIEQTLRSEFSFIDAPDNANAQLLEEIGSKESVSIHVRRGDYLLPQYFSTHGVCSMDYYHAAVRELTSEIEQPHFFVFSDDPEWTRDNLHFDFPSTYVDHNGAGKDYEDFRLMSNCKHHIIANSTFSWWAAWLGTCPSKIVIAPKRWYMDSTIDTADLIPDSWRTV